MPQADFIPVAVMQVPIYVRALDLRHSAELKAAGADNVITATTEAGMALGSCMLQELGARPKDLAGLTRAVRKQLDARSVNMRRQLTSKSQGADGSQPALTDVFVFDHAAVSKGDQPSTLAGQSDGDSLPRGQEDAAALGVQNAPVDQPAVSSKVIGNHAHQLADAGPSSDKEASRAQQSDASEGANGSQSSPANVHSRDRFRDGSESCPVDSRPSLSNATSITTADD